MSSQGPADSIQLLLSLSKESGLAPNPPPRQGSRRPVPPKPSCPPLSSGSFLGSPFRPLASTSLRLRAEPMHTLADYIRLHLPPGGFWDSWCPVWFQGLCSLFADKDGRGWEL